VNTAGANAPLLPAERQLVEASAKEARIEGHRWTSKAHLGPRMSKIDRVCSGFKRSATQVKKGR
jgi:hypothetical protein